MPEEQATPRNRRFYRRIKGNQWQDEARQTLQDTAFHLGEGEMGLSVFDADIATPRAVLEDQLNIWTVIAQDPNKPEKDHRWANKKLEQCDSSVEGMLAQGWGVAEVTEGLFRRCNVEPAVEIDPNGHLEILGTKEAFEEQSLEIIDDPECRVLTDDECRA